MCVVCAHVTVGYFDIFETQVSRESFYTQGGSFDVRCKNGSVGTTQVVELNQPDLGLVHDALIALILLAKCRWCKIKKRVKAENKCNVLPQSS